jgi:hypothetical protein
LGLGSFDNPEGPLVRRQASIPITFGGVEFLKAFNIAPIAYLGSCSLVISVIAARFMVDHRPFLLETLAQVDNNTFFF